MSSFQDFNFNTHIYPGLRRWAFIQRPISIDTFFFEKTFDRFSLKNLTIQKSLKEFCARKNECSKKIHSSVQATTQSNSKIGRSSGHGVRATYGKGSV